MKKIVFGFLAVILCCFSFCLAGCNLFVEDNVKKNEQIAVEAGSITLTREEFVKGFNNYYSSFYNDNEGDSDAALEDLIEYLIGRKIYLQDAENLIKENNISLSKAEKNYIWNSVYTAIISNIDSFEEKVKTDLNIEDEEADEDKTQESNFIYTPYDKLAEVVYNDDTNEYEIVISTKVLVENTLDDGEKEYKYVLESESSAYGEPSIIFDIDWVNKKVDEIKLFDGQTNLTTEQVQSKKISAEALRRYVVQLKENEEGKNLSTIDDEVFNREIERIYTIVYENLLINKLYRYKASSIDVSEEEVLELYLEKVKETYERYSLDDEAFTKELTTTVGSAKYYAGYSTESECVEDIFYVPVNNEEGSEKYFNITHIVIKLTEIQIQKINELKQYYESNKESLASDYYDVEFAKIVDKTKMKLDERDSEGYIVVKSTDINAISVQQMLDNLSDNLDEINDKYYGTTGLITLERSGENRSLVLEQLEVDYSNERADKFNEYIYKYSDDEGTIQIQKTLISGTTNENWYLYGLGTDDTDAGFEDNFVNTARNLYNGTVEAEDLINSAQDKETTVALTMMESWETTDSVSTLKSGSTGYSVMMYCGEVTNLFECFDTQKFDLADLLAEETTNGLDKYSSLLKMDYKRLGLTMNKTLFDLIFEEIYEDKYTELTTIYEDESLKDIKIIKHENVYKDLLG